MLKTISCCYILDICACTINYLKKDVILIVENFVIVGSYRECAVKFNDYFEFPREVDMSPYTAATLAKLEGNFVKCKIIELFVFIDIQLGMCLYV